MNLTIGELLATVGPLQPHAVAFNAGVLAESTQEASSIRTAAAYSQSKSSSSSGGSKNATAAVVAALPAVLQLLAGYLLDDDIAVIRATHMTLRYVTWTLLK